MATNWEQGETLPSYGCSLAWKSHEWEGLTYHWLGKRPAKWPFLLHVCFSLEHVYPFWKQSDFRWSLSKQLRRGAGTRLEAQRDFTHTRWKRWTTFTPQWQAAPSDGDKPVRIFTPWHALQLESMQLVITTLRTQRFVLVVFVCLFVVVVVFFVSKRYTKTKSKSMTNYHRRNFCDALSEKLSLHASDSECKQSRWICSHSELMSLSEWQERLPMRQSILCLRCERTTWDAFRAWAPGNVWNFSTFVSRQRCCNYHNDALLFFPFSCAVKGPAGFENGQSVRVYLLTHSIPICSGSVDEVTK